jgi:hypothetical protein
MIERFNIDVIADAILAQMMSGAPHAKLPHRFFRKGRRDGRRQLSPVPVAAVIQSSVKVATSRVEEAYLDARRKLVTEIATIESQIKILDEELATDEGTAAIDRTGDHSSGGHVPSEAMSPEGSEPEVRRTPLEQAVIAANAARATAEAAAKERDRLAKREGWVEERSAARTRVEGLKTELDELDDRFETQQQTCREVGRFLYTRYVSGYEYGQTRLLRRVKDRTTIDPRIDLDEGERIGARVGGGRAEGES